VRSGALVSIEMSKSSLQDALAPCRRDNKNIGRFDTAMQNAVLIQVCEADKGVQKPQHLHVEGIGIADFSGA